MVTQQGLPLATKSDRRDYMVEDTDVFDFELSQDDEFVYVRIR